MTNRFVWVSWNRHKRVYDALLAAGMLVFLIAYAVFANRGEDRADSVALLIRGTGALALMMLHVILCIGPLSRFTDLVSPLLYNRRHMGVAMFGVGLVHAVLVLGYYGGFGGTDPFSAVLLAGRSFGSVAAFPYELLGLAGLIVLFVMAATSHDFWLDLLGPAAWKWIHMSVYAAYALLVGHAMLGSLAGEGVEGGPGLRFWVLSGGVVVVVTLHLLAGLREMVRDEMGETPIEADAAAPERVGWIDVGTVDEIPEGRAKVVCLSAQTGVAEGGLRGERVAVFRSEGTLSAVTNVCAHQGGPLGEGAIIGGCITCPWHGYQYEPDSGCSPPPYTEKIATYRLRVEGRRVYLDPRALAPGTRIEPVFFEASPEDDRLFEDVEVDRADSSIDRPVDLTIANASEAGVDRDGHGTTGEGPEIGTSDEKGDGPVRTGF